MDGGTGAVNYLAKAPSAGLLVVRLLAYFRWEPLTS